jgi:hypothetical protein
MKMRITALPDIDKFLFVAEFDFESVHCDIHRNLDPFIRDENIIAMLTPLAISSLTQNLPSF